MSTGPTMSGYSWSHHVPRAPLHDQGVTSLVVVSRSTSAGVTPPSSLLRAHASVLHPLRTSVAPSVPGLCRLRSAPAGKRTFPTLLCPSVPACLDPYPGSSRGASTRFFPRDSGLPPVRTGSALSNTPYSDCSTARFFEAAVLHACSGPQVCSPPRSLLPLRHTSVGQPWFFRPSLS